MRTVVILGATASGKSDLSIKLAQEMDAYILSLDSLSIYKYIDIASAKPTKEERGEILHFGIDEIEPDQNFSVALFFEIYKKADKKAKEDNKNLIIVGGTGFYLKALIEGINDKPTISQETKKRVQEKMENLQKAYQTIEKLDYDYAKKISPNDRYRIEKWFEIYIQSGEVASEYFKNSDKEPLLREYELYEIETDRELLRERIKLRTHKMIQNGLIDEVIWLERNYTREPNCMKAIGIKETLDYLDGIYNKKQMREKIITNTARLAKRQRTFNSTQFPLHVKADAKTLYDKILLNDNPYQY